VQLDVGDDRAGDPVDLLGLLVGPHGGTELCGVLVGALAEGRYRSDRGIWDRDSDIPSGRERTRTSGLCSVTLASTSSMPVELLAFD
jgi:hypothetical protein